MFKIGINQKNITPHETMWLSGYAPMRQFTGVHDDLYVRTHSFFNENTKEMTIFSTFDLVGVDALVVNQVKKKLNEKFIEWKIEVHLSATHTHSAPAGSLDTRDGIKETTSMIFGEFNQEYTNRIIDACVQTVIESYQQRDTFVYKVMIDELHGVGADRHSPELPGDPSLLVFEFKTNQSKSILYNFACHPTVLSADNTLLSADLPGSVANRLKDDYEVVQFINGNAANISTRFTRNEQSFEQIERFSEKMVKKISEVKLAPEQTLQSIATYPYQIDLEIKEPVDKEITEGLIKNLVSEKEKTSDLVLQARYQSKIEGYQNELNLSTTLEKVRRLKLNYSIITFDHLVFLSIPGEISSELFVELKKKYPLFVFGYTNDYLFYFTSKEAYDANEYEAKSSFLRRGEIEKLIDELDAKLDTLSR